MYSAQILVFLGLWAVVLGEPEINEAELVAMIQRCAKDNNITSGDMANIEENIKNPSDDMLCFMKCISERDGSLDKDGKIIHEHLDTFLSAMKFEESVVKKVKECALKIPPIKECKDMKPLSDCFPDLH